MGALRPWTWSRTALRRGFQALVALSVLPLVPMTWVWLTSAGHRVTAAPGTRWAAEVPVMPAALVLGAGVRGRQPTPMLRARLDIAAELYRAGRVRALLLSGDNSRRDYDEPSVMRDYLISTGVPAGRIVLDYAGFDTWDSCVRAKEIFGASRLVVVTQVFHLPRAVALCRTAGLDAFGVGDDSSRDWPAETVAYAVREFPASAKGLVDALVLRSSPRFLGPRETALDQAVAR
ncbi:vancomycin high temperature exclusion protein [Microbispora sp. H11081]|uniref:SanA/YdcF family protein n=1 Tax=Microbispora sp. H11081 TaxID=2729107 RepID=UPI0020164EFB|nr:ElyC/SanA/YdcF family protein [Microbispora sp. H11081]